MNINLVLGMVKCLQRYNDCRNRLPQYLRKLSIIMCIQMALSIFDDKSLLLNNIQPKKLLGNAIPFLNKIKNYVEEKQSPIQEEWIFSVQT